MSSPQTVLHPERSSWRTGFLAPMNIAAYVTWLAVFLQAVPLAPLWAGHPRIWAGTLALLLFLLLLLVRAGGEHRPASQAWLLILIFGQGCASLLSTQLLQNGSTGILLIIVAGQLFALFSLWSAVAMMLILNVGLVWVWSFGLPLTRLPLAIVPLMGFQAFAAMTARYAVMAERAREQLTVLNGELRATQSLLDSSARSSERLKLSRELHDVAGHKLTALKLNLRVLQRDSELAGRSEVQVSAALADELLADIRAVVSELRQHDGIELSEALRHLVGQIPGPRFVLELDPQLRVASVQAAQTLLRCAQEAITNALRHGQPQEIRLSAQAEAGGVAISVSDDGSKPARIQFGNGLTGMQERLEELGGTLTVQARPERGVELCAWIPLAADAAAQFSSTAAP